MSESVETASTGFVQAFEQLLTCLERQGEQLFSGWRIQRRNPFNGRAVTIIQQGEQRQLLHKPQIGVRHCGASRAISSFQFQAITRGPGGKLLLAHLETFCAAASHVAGIGAGKALLVLTAYAFEGTAQRKRSASGVSAHPHRQFAVRTAEVRTDNRGQNLEQTAHRCRDLKFRHQRGSFLAFEIALVDFLDLFIGQVADFFGAVEILGHGKVPFLGLS
jgi:hypothetical protein